MHFFLTVHPPNSVFALYTSLAMLYVGYHGRKGFWKLKEKFLQHIQPNLWTVLIVIISFFFLGRIFCLTLPNEMPKEILKAVGCAVFLYNCTVF